MGQGFQECRLALFRYGFIMRLPIPRVLSPARVIKRHGGMRAAINVPLTTTLLSYRFPQMCVRSASVAKEALLSSSSPLGSQFPVIVNGAGLLTAVRSRFNMWQNCCMRRGAAANRQ